MTRGSKLGRVLLAACAVTLTVGALALGTQPRYDDTFELGTRHTTAAGLHETNVTLLVARPGGAHRPVLTGAATALGVLVAAAILRRRYRWAPATPPRPGNLPARRRAPPVFLLAS
ncbi:MAG TPA: hypothetical protein VN636_01280 [Acidimicrobiia bacterium]|nr:hypothetical protein [Acidimicrobiia bacterium]